MANEKFIALEETSQEIKTTVNDVKTNVDGLKNTDVPGIDETVNATYEKTLELERKIGGTGGAFFIYSDMSVKNAKSKIIITGSDYFYSNYGICGFIKGNDVYILYAEARTSTGLQYFRVEKISDFETKPVKTVLITNQEFNNNEAIAVCTDYERYFYMLTSEYNLLEIDTVNQSVTSLGVISATTNYKPKCFNVSSDGNYFTWIYNTSLYIWDRNTGKLVSRSPYDADNIKYALWFDANNDVIAFEYYSGRYYFVKYPRVSGNASRVLDYNLSPVTGGVRASKDYIYAGHDATNRLMYKFDKRTFGYEDLNIYPVLNSVYNVVLQDLRKGSLVVTGAKSIISYPAYRTGEICMYMKAGNVVYTDARVRDMSGNAVAADNETITIQTDGKYLFSDYSYMRVG